MDKVAASSVSVLTCVSKISDTPPTSAQDFFQFSDIYPGLDHPLELTKLVILSVQKYSLLWLHMPRNTLLGLIHDDVDFDYTWFESVLAEKPPPCLKNALTACTA